MEEIEIDRCTEENRIAINDCTNNEVQVHWEIKSLVKTINSVCLPFYLFSFPLPI